MRFSLVALASVIATALPVAAQAVVTVFNVNNGVFTSNSQAAGTLTGSFSIDFNTNPTTITQLNLVSSASGSFSSITYNNPANVSAAQGANNNFRVTINSGVDTLQLLFSSPLTATSGSTINSTNSYETQTDKNPSNRFLSGSVSVASVPEPAAWGMMVVGFGLIGASVRYGRRRTAITFA